MSSHQIMILSLRNLFSIEICEIVQVINAKVLKRKKNGCKYFAGMWILREFAEFHGILLNFASIGIHILIDLFLNFRQNFEFIIVAISGCKMLNNGRRTKIQSSTESWESNLSEYDFEFARNWEEFRGILQICGEFPCLIHVAKDNSGMF